MTYSTIPPIRKRATLLAALLGGLFSLAASAQNFSGDWIRTLEQNGAEAGLSIAVDSLEGSVYVAGYSSTGITVPVVDANSGSTDAYLAKYRNDGTLLWAFLAGSTGADAFTDVSVGPTGQVFVTGYFTGTVDFTGSAAGAAGALTSAGLKDAVTASYNGLNGALVWRSRFGALGDDEGVAISSDANGVASLLNVFGNLTINGVNSGAALPLDKNIALVRQTLAGGNGWVRYGTSEALSLGDAARDVASNGTYVAVSYWVDGFTATWYNGSTSLNTHTSFGDRSLHITEFTNAGAFLWTTVVFDLSNELTSAPQPGAMAMGCGGLYLTGWAHGFSTIPGTLPMPAPAHDVVYTARLDLTDGSGDWVRTGFSTSSNQHVAAGLAIAIGDHGQVHITGTYTDDITFDNGATVHGTQEGMELFLVSYGPDGALIGSQSFEGNGDQRSTGIGVDNFGGLFLGGTFSEEVDLGTMNESGPADDNLFVVRVQRGGGPRIPDPRTHAFRCTYNDL